MLQLRNYLYFDKIRIMLLYLYTLNSLMRSIKSQVCSPRRRKWKFGGDASLGFMSYLVELIIIYRNGILNGKRDLHI